MRAHPFPTVLAAEQPPRSLHHHRAAVHHADPARRTVISGAVLQRRVVVRFAEAKGTVRTFLAERNLAHGGVDWLLRWWWRRAGNRRSILHCRCVVAAVKRHAHRIKVRMCVLCALTIGWHYLHRAPTICSLRVFPSKEREPEKRAAEGREYSKQTPDC